MLIKILLSGDGGQGIQLIANMICQASFANDFHVTSIPNYGLEQRGGVSLNFIQISDKKITYPKFTKPDLLLVLSQQARERVEKFKNERCVIFDIKDFEDKLKENNIPKKSYNIFFLSQIASVLEEKNVCRKEDIFKMLEKKLSSKSGWEENKLSWNFKF